jgi:hypothetical protein
VLFRSLDLKEHQDISKAADAIERYKLRGHCTSSWIRKLRLTWDAGNAQPQWIDSVIRLLAHVVMVSDLTLEPCSPAMLAVASATCATSLKSLRIGVYLASIPFAHVSYLSNFTHLQKLDLCLYAAKQWSRDQPAFTFGGRLPALKHLSFDGVVQSEFFHMLGSYRFDALERVDIYTGNLRPDDWQHLWGFLGAHALQRFTFRGSQDLEQTLDICRHVRAAHLGLPLYELPPPYTAVIQSVPRTTQRLILFYHSDFNSNWGELMKTIITHTPVLEGIGIQSSDNEHPFTWTPDPDTVDDVEMHALRLLKLTHWSNKLADLGIPMWDENGKTLRECVLEA